MIEEITIKFGTELKLTQNSCKLQLYKKRKIELIVLKTFYISNKNGVKTFQK